MQFGDSWRHPVDPFSQDPILDELRMRFNGSWTNAQNLRVQDPLAVKVKATISTARVVAVWDGESLAYGPFQGEQVIPIDYVKGQDLRFYTDDASSGVELSATSYDPTRIRNLAADDATEAMANQAIQAVQYKRGQLHSLHVAKGGGADYQTGALATFVNLLDKWLNDYAPEWLEKKDYGTIVSTAKGIVANVDSTLKQDDENLFAFAEDMKRGVEENIDKATGKASSILTLVVIGLVAIAAIQIAQTAKAVV